MKALFKKHSLEISIILFTIILFVLIYKYVSNNAHLFNY